MSGNLGHFWKAGLPASGGFTLKRNAHSCREDERKESEKLSEKSGWTTWQILVFLFYKQISEDLFLCVSFLRKVCGAAQNNNQHNKSDMLVIFSVFTKK